MTSVDNGLQIEWLVACLSPGDIAPHPNFRTDSARGAELLALIVQFQWHEYATYRDLAGDNDGGTSRPPHDDAILDAARRALETGTVLDGLRDLVRIAEDERNPLGQRAAAALLAATTGSELDEPEAHLGTLSELAALIENSAAGSTSSRNLSVGVLLQQCALRALEAGRRSESRAYAQRVVSTLADVGDHWDEFAVSRGIGWSAVDSQRRLVELAAGNARSLLVATSDHLDKSWTEIVRAPFPAADTRPTRDALSALGTVVEEVVKQNYSSTKRVRVFGGGDTALTLLYSSLLHAELAGDLASTARLRQTLGNVFSVRLANDPSNEEWYAEAIRLLRQGDAEDHLRRLLQVVRMQGPLEILRLAAERLIDTRAEQSFVSSTDLALFDRSADLISPSYTDRAIDLALRYAGQGRDGRVKGSHVVDWKRTETSLKAASALVSGNSQADMGRVARSVLHTVQDAESAGNQFVFSALAQLSSNINWDAVPSEIRNDWLTLLNAAASPYALPIDHLRAHSAMGAPQPEDLRNRLKEHELVAALVGGLLGDPPANEDLNMAVTNIVETLDEIRADAAVGKFTGYSWSPFALAAYLIVRFSRTDLWPALYAAVTDPRVPTEGKVDALKVLASEVARVSPPPNVRERLTSQPIPSAGVDQISFFEVPPEQFNVACRNFYLAFDLVTPNEAQGAVLRDAGSRDVEVRSGSAHSCFLIAARDPLLEWPQILLLQLSYDRDSLVRNAASRGLAHVSVLPQVALADAIVERVISLLEEPGIAMTMGALQGLAAGARHQQRSLQSLWCQEKVASLMNEHPSRNVREAARAVLEAYRSPKLNASHGS